jgi:hypothetical protein
LTMWGVDLKYFAPIAQHLEGYVHGSMSSARADGGLEGYAGRGLGGGAGIQLKGRVRALGFLAWPLFFAPWGPKVAASLWLDTSYEMYRLHAPGPAPGPSIDGQLTHVTFGFSIGSDL